MNLINNLSVSIKTSQNCIYIRILAAKNTILKIALIQIFLATTIEIIGCTIIAFINNVSYYGSYHVILI